MASKGIPLEIGLRIDVLDDEGIWNTGRIADVAREGDDMVEIKYDGWGDEYNQWIPVSADRLAPLHTYTLVKKCWAKLTKWPWWPAFVVLRAPTTQSAAAGLEEEKKLYVEFFDSFDEDKRSRQVALWLLLLFGCWMQKKSVVSFQDGFEERASKNVGKKFPKYVEGTQRAAAGNSPLLFSGNGTLPIEYSSKMALPLATQRQKYDSDKWFDAYRMFSKRYDVLYGYEFAADPARQFASVCSDDDDAEVAAGNGRGSGKKKKSKARSAQEDVEERSFGYEDENEPEEKEEEPEEDADAAEEEEEVEEKAPKGSARGRRNTRLQDKRQREPALPTRRTRARRVKVIEELLESSSASRTATIAQPFQVLVSPADQRDSTSDLALDASGNSMALLREGETETGGDWSGATVHVNTTDADKQAAVSATSHDAEPVGEQLGDGLKEPAASTYVGDGCGTHSRRKAKLSAPQRLSAIRRKRLANTAAAGEQESAADACSEGDHWSGGSKHEIAGQPWTIGGWLVHGYRAAADK